MPSATMPSATTPASHSSPKSDRRAASSVAPLPPWEVTSTPPRAARSGSETRPVTLAASLLTAKVRPKPTGAAPSPRHASRQYSPPTAATHWLRAPRSVVDSSSSVPLKASRAGESSGSRRTVSERCSTSEEAPSAPMARRRCSMLAAIALLAAGATCDRRYSTHAPGSPVARRQSTASRWELCTRLTTAMPSSCGSIASQVPPRPAAMRRSTPGASCGSSPTQFNAAPRRARWPIRSVVETLHVATAASQAMRASSAVSRARPCASGTRSTMSTSNASCCRGSPLLLAPEQRQTGAHCHTRALLIPEAGSVRSSGERRSERNVSRTPPRVSRSTAAP
mmetsp:Transcript_9708/g.30399  ORF Transcript_9708/g.30399 Transcript_9708/m.30399 type:complete len:338 (-) Transcript_9708:2348-3361(-)